MEQRNKYASEEARELFSTMEKQFKIIEKKVNQLVGENIGARKEIQYIKETSNRIENKVDTFMGCLNDKADKKEVDGLKTEFEKMKDEREKRNYDWLKYGITVFVSVLISFLIFHSTKGG